MGAKGQPSARAAFAVAAWLLALGMAVAVNGGAQAQGRTPNTRLSDLEARADDLTRRMAELQARIRALAGTMAPDYELPPSLRTNQAPRVREPRKPAAQSARTIATLYFPERSSQLGAPERAAIARLAADQTTSRRPITLIAHADEEGSPRYNWQMSVQRARRVAEALQAAGIPPATLVVWACGRNRPAAQCSANAQCAPENRRVAVVGEAIEAGLDGCERTLPAAS